MIVPEFEPLKCGSAWKCSVHEYGKCTLCSKGFEVYETHYLLHGTHTREMACEKCWKSEAGTLWRLAL